LDQRSSGLSWFSGGAKLFEIGLAASEPRSMFTALDEASEMVAFENWSSIDSSICHQHGWACRYCQLLEDFIPAKEVVATFSLCSNVMASLFRMRLDLSDSIGFGLASSSFAFHLLCSVSSSSAS